MIISMLLTEEPWNSSGKADASRQLLRFSAEAMTLITLIHPPESGGGHGVLCPVGLHEPVMHKYAQTQYQGPNLLNADLSQNPIFLSKFNLLCTGLRIFSYSLLFYWRNPWQIYAKKIKHLGRFLKPPCRTTHLNERFRSTEPFHQVAALLEKEILESITSDQRWVTPSSTGRHG